MFAKQARVRPCARWLCLAGAVVGLLLPANALAQPLSPGIARILPGLVRIREAVVINQLPEGLDGLVDTQAHREDQNRAILLAKSRANPKKFVDFYDLAKAEGWAKISRERLEDDLCESLHKAFFADGNAGPLFKRGATDEANLNQLKTFLEQQLPKVLSAEPYAGYEVALLSRQRIGGYDQARQQYPFVSDLASDWMPLTLTSSRDPSASIQMKYAPMPAPEGIPATTPGEIARVRALPSRDVYVALVLRVVGYDAATAFNDTLLVEPVSAKVFPSTSLDTPVHVYQPVDFRLDENDLLIDSDGERPNRSDLDAVASRQGASAGDSGSGDTDDSGQVTRVSDGGDPNGGDSDGRKPGDSALPVSGSGDVQAAAHDTGDSQTADKQVVREALEADGAPERTPEEFRTMALRTIIVLGALCVIVLTYRVVNR